MPHSSDNYFGLNNKDKFTHEDLGEILGKCYTAVKQF